MKQTRSGLFWVTTQHTIVIPYPHIKANYRSHFQGSRSLTLVDGTERVPDMLVRNIHYTLCNNPEEWRSQYLGSII